MMAGTGVSAGGAGMLRARRRDVSVKPNRKLDRKSSRGMIYENEELRLRTIHINAEVEQGQNDIKKLRRENEQLRREIWSLRDEYDKLEDILKSQKNREGSEDYEDRSEDDKDDDDEAEDCSDYSAEEDSEGENRDEEYSDVAVDDEPQEPQKNHSDREERLENAENQKISSEKMTSSLHRLHVEFDDLSVVDEEDELRKDKERREAISTEEKDIANSPNDPGSIRMDRSGYQCFRSHYGSPGASASGYARYPDCPFVYPNADEPGCSDILPTERMLLTPCPAIYDEENLRNGRLAYGTAVGWQSSVFPPAAVFPASEGYRSSVVAARASGVCLPSIFAASSRSDRSSATASTARATSVPRRTPIEERGSSTRLANLPDGNVSDPSSLARRRNLLLEQPSGLHRGTSIPVRGTETPATAEASTRNGWEFSATGGAAGESRAIPRGTEDRECRKELRRDAGESGETVGDADGGRGREDSAGGTAAAGSDRPKHFFAPLPAKIRRARRNSGDETSGRGGAADPDDPASAAFFESHGTGRSSSGERTDSTVVSAGRLPASLAAGDDVDDGAVKGSADVCVSGAIPARANDPPDRPASGSCKSSENPPTEIDGDRDDSRGNGSSRRSSDDPLVKSLSCYDLTSDTLHSSLYDVGGTFGGERSLKFARSDNTLDNPAAVASKPFRSQLNVTLRCPAAGDRRRDSPETPEIPELPSIGYRPFGDPFLESFAPVAGSYSSHGLRGPPTRPLPIRANDGAIGGSIDRWSPLLTRSFARRPNADGRPSGSARTPTTAFANETEGDRHRFLPAGQPADTRIIPNPEHRREFRATSFERPDPRCLHPALGAFDVDAVGRIPAAGSSTERNHRKLYRNVPFVPGAGGIFCGPGQAAARMFYDDRTPKVPAQTQTSIDGGSNDEDEAADETAKDSRAIGPEDAVPGSPTSVGRKRNVRKERSRTTDKRPLSPAAQRRKSRKQTSNVDGLEADKAGGKSRKSSPATTTTTTSEHPEDKNESRSSSSGQESPRKDRNRRVSVYFNGKKRPSLASVRTARSASIDNRKEGFETRGDALDTTNSERERTNSVSSREAAGGKARKSSVGSGKVPWCACWGNGCI